jgi:puromycin-sensitive aminopeptidase
VDNFFPEYDYWTQFASGDLSEALHIDALKNSHPIEVPVTDPSEIDEIFDDISYSKGCSIIRMMCSYIGDAASRKGLNIYLSKYQYSNAETVDLWADLEEASGLPVGKVMSTFTKQMGFPLVTVAAVEQIGLTRVFTLKQQKFWADPKLHAKKCDQKWVIPLSFSKGSDPGKVAHDELFDGTLSDEIKVVIPNVGADEWVKVPSFICL